jgi:hypothetical protein
LNTLGCSFFGIVPDENITISILGEKETYSLTRWPLRVVKKYLRQLAGIMYLHERIGTGFAERCFSLQNDLCSGLDHFFM